MDQVKFSRLIPTGSATVYAAEFKRGNQYVYALWTADGEQKAKLQFKQKAQGILTEMLGKESKVAADVLDIEITESPAYLTLNVPIQNIMPDGNRSFKKHNKELKEKLGSQKVYSIALDSKDQLKVVPGRDARLEFNHTPNPVSMGLRSAGNYELQNINDAEKGQCVAIRLLPASEPVKTPLMSEYGVFRLNEPIVLPGKPTTIGAEVYGNSSWGKFFWELEDADGEIWLSAGSTGYGCNVHDWPDKAGFSFDGWKTMAFPIAKESPITVYAPGENEWQWQHAGSNGDNQITYPVKLKGIAVALNRKSLVLKDMQDVEPVVKIKSISVWE